MIDFICFSINNWEKRKARKQQFMLHLSKRGDVGKILYIEPPLNLWRLLLSPGFELKTRENQKRWKRALSFKVEPLSGKLFLFTPLLFMPFSFKFQFIYDFNLFFSFLIINAKIKRLGFKNIVLWLYHPFDRLLLKWFRNRVLSVFDWAEDWGEYFTDLNYKRRVKIKEYEETIIKGADIVFVVSEYLLKRAQKINDRSYQILDGTIPEIFVEKQKEPPADMKHIPRPIIAYSGSVYRRVDLGLIASLSRQLPHCSIVLLGNILYETREIDRVKEKNVFFLGGKEYSDLPDYMMNFDVLIMPDIPSPSRPPATKIYDYFATGKPIVSTNIPEIEKFKDCVKIANTSDEFVRLVKAALAENDPQLINTRKQIARDNSWEKRASEIMEIANIAV